MFETNIDNSKETSTVDRTFHPDEPKRRFFTVVYPALHISAPLADAGLRIGRTSENGQLALDDDRASRKYAKLARVNTDVSLLAIADLGSKNGTFLNGVRIQREVLRGCAVIRIGETLIVVNEIRPPPDNAPLAPEFGKSMALTYAEHCTAVAAATPLPVLITGPSGAAKDRLAKRIHRLSGRPGPLISVNCATFSSELLASELFGHKKGAFSGANSSRDGLFVTAQNGTLFLDEIADLPLTQQAALLRALQDKRVKPIGADHEIAVDVRIVAATHRDLRNLVDTGEFRGDLYARLAGITVPLPGLADRREDILPLFRMFLEEDLPLSPDAAEALLIYDWPFNVRELQHAAQGARAFAKHAGRVDLGLLPTGGSKRSNPINVRRSHRRSRQTPGHRFAQRASRQHHERRQGGWANAPADLSASSLVGHRPNHMAGGLTACSTVLYRHFWVWFLFLLLFLLLRELRQ